MTLAGEKYILNLHDLLYFPMKQNSHIETDDQIMRVLVHPSVVLISVDQKTKENVLSIIRNARNQKNDLIINIIFGAYKSENIPSSYTANWAEIFNIRFMLQILSKIAYAYPRQITLEYILQDTYLNHFNNISLSETENYILSFLGIVDFYNGWIQKNNLNIRITAKRESEIIDKKIFKLRLEENVEIIKNQWNKESNSFIKNTAIERAARNYRKINPSQQDIFESAVFHSAYIQTCIELDIRQSKSKILLVHRKMRPSGELTIPYRSCSSSAVQFWIGEGCIVSNGRNTFSTILSPRRINEYRFIQRICNDEINFNNKNLKKIDVYEPI